MMFIIITTFRGVPVIEIRDYFTILFRRFCVPTLLSKSRRTKVCELYISQGFVVVIWAFGRNLNRRGQSRVEIEGFSVTSFHRILGIEATNDIAPTVGYVGSTDRPIGIFVV